MSKRKQRLKGNKNKGGYLEHLRKADDQWEPIDNACEEEYRQDVLKKITHMIDTLALKQIIEARSKEEIDCIVEGVAKKWAEKELDQIKYIEDRYRLRRNIGPFSGRTYNSWKVVDKPLRIEEFGTGYRIIPTTNDMDLVGHIAFYKMLYETLEGAAIRCSTIRIGDKKKPKSSYTEHVYNADGRKCTITYTEEGGCEFDIRMGD